jgi:hypothetical protein
MRFLNNKYKHSKAKHSYNSPMKCHFPNNWECFFYELRNSITCPVSILAVSVIVASFLVREKDKWRFLQMWALNNDPEVNFPELR